MQVETLLDSSAARFPQKTALVCDDRRLTYSWIEQHSNRIAHGLIRAGVEPGDRVAVCLDNSVDAVLAIFAILKAGAVLVPLNPTTKVDKLARLLNDSGARAVVGRNSRARELEACLKNVPSVQALILSGDKVTFRAAALRVDPLNDLISDGTLPLEAPRKKTIDLDLAAILYTSGSTGTQKGVMITHLNMVSAATSVIEYLSNTEDDVILNVLPLSFSYGLYQVLMAFKVGATLVLERSFAYPHAVLQKFAEEKVTGFAIVPTISAVLLQLDLSGYSFSSLRYLTNAGAALPPQHALQLRRIFPDTQLFLMYGLTECKRVSYLPPDQVDARPESVGKAMPNVEAYVVDETGKRVFQGEVGELVVRGSNVMRGYWNRPEETERALRPDPETGEQVLHTGDLFRTDTEGYLYYVGRRDDMIKSRGEKVSPVEVENVLYQLDGVSMAAVVGVPDPIVGAAIKAVVALRPGARLTENDVLRHCAKYLEDFMVPGIVEFRDIPRTASGKIDRLALAGGAQT